MIIVTKNEIMVLVRKAIILYFFELQITPDKPKSPIVEMTMNEKSFVNTINTIEAASSKIYHNSNKIDMIMSEISPFTSKK